MTVAPAPAPSADAAPIPCPLCEYDLRGLAEPRCPECGYRFTWDELNDPSRRFHPWLFEHHPRRNLWSFGRTLAHGQLPTTFWSTLYPTQPSRPGRILAYWVLCALPMLAAATALATYDVARVIPTPNKVSWWVLARWAASNDINGGGSTALYSLMLLVWPWVTLPALLVFQVSLRRARLRWVHVLRCVLYSADVVVWCAVPVAAIALFAWDARKWPPPRTRSGTLRPWSRSRWAFGSRTACSSRTRFTSASTMRRQSCWRLR